MTLHEFIQWLGATPASTLFQDVSWIIPVTQSIHILCIAIVFSSATMVDLRMLGVIGRSQPTASYASRFLPWIWPTLLVLLITGSILITAEPNRSLGNPAFWTKMTLLVLAMIFTFILQRPFSKDPAFWELSGGRKAIGAVIAVITLLLWVGIIFCGRWIAYITVSD
jgi:hypothetical protein